MDILVLVVVETWFEDEGFSAVLTGDGMFMVAYQSPLLKLGTFPEKIMIRSVLTDMRPGGQLKVIPLVLRLE